MTLGSCSISEVLQCDSNHSVIKVSRILRDKNARHVLVVDKGKPVGVISVTDINNRLVAEDKDASETKVYEIMSKDIIVKDKNDGLTKTYVELLKANKYSCVIVDKGKVKGMIDMKELMNCIVKEKNKNGRIKGS
ncbi:CBS domain-containing protein [Candidatus Pacearchaeota archaeon]|nr:CBS domain-containing protein [Candidatus Pacearchaeota archaeon]